MACTTLVATLVMGAVQFLTEVALYYTIVKSQKIASRTTASTSELFQSVRSVRECVREGRELELFMCKVSCIGSSSSEGGEGAGAVHVQGIVYW
jgi:hypothetical protein